MSNTLSFSLSTWKLYCSLILSKSLFLFSFGFKSEQRRIFQSLLRKSSLLLLLNLKVRKHLFFFSICFLSLWLVPVNLYFVMGHRYMNQLVAGLYLYLVIACVIIICFYGERYMFILHGIYDIGWTISFASLLTLIY